MDGPVVAAAKAAVDAGSPNALLPFVPAAAEDEVKAAFERAMAARKQGEAAREVADRWLFETVVRLHRAGEGAPFTGLKPAGLGHGPVVPVAERALESGHPERLVALLTDTIQEEVMRRFDEAMRLKGGANGDIEANRRYVEAMLGLQGWSHRLYEAARSTAHGARPSAHGSGSG
jgi:hypothetical protein